MQNVILIILMCLIQTAQADERSVTLHGGMLRFQGEVFSDTCTVNDGDRLLTLPMGEISTNQFKKTGDYADAVPFEIRFSYCNKNVSRNMAVVFHGVSDEINVDLLAIEDRDNAAKGVAIALFDQDGQMIPLNSGQVPVRPDASGPYTLHLVAKYRATQDHVVGGYANAQAWFTLIYQ